MLKVSNLSRSYGNFIAVDDVSFSINKGEIIGLLGHNGAGKTTIMKMVSGYLEADDGEVTLDDISLNTDAKLLQQQLGYLPENLPIYPEMTVAEYLDYVADLKALTGNNKINEIQRVIEATDLSLKILARIDTLSRGYKQRLGVAQAILAKPKLLILDEPTNGLDPDQTKQMRALIKEIATDATVIISTHIMQEVNALCDRVLILKSGKLVLDETLDALQQSKHLVIETDCSDNDLIKAIAGVAMVTNIAKQTLLVELAEENYAHIIGAEISKKIINSGSQLFALYARKRDLETVFNQINNEALTGANTTQVKSNKEVTNAA